MKMLGAIGGFAALMFVSAGAHAVTIQSTYSVDANAVDPGLQIQTAENAANPFTYNLLAGQSVTFDLFDIWTNENSLDFGLFSGCGADCDPKPISVSFGFLMPENGQSTVTGTTRGDFDALISQEGELRWDGPQTFSYGANGDGLIEVALSDEDFNTGLFGLDEGRGAGATVQASLSLLNDASPMDVPEPKLIGLLGLMLIATGLVARQRRDGRIG